MTVAVNRVLLAFKTWEERKKEVEPLFKAGAADTGTLARLQLDHLRQAAHRLRRSVRPDEKPFMLLLNNRSPSWKNSYSRICCCGSFLS
jgi:hypothetical protein